MARALTALLLAALVALPAGAQGPLEPSGRLPPVAPPATPPPRKATPVEPTGVPTALPRGAILEQVSGTVRDVDRAAHKFTVDVAGDLVTLSMDRNTMVYTAAGLGTVRDVVPGVPIRAGRNAEFVAYWVQVRPTAAKPAVSPSATPGPGNGPAGGSGPPPEGGGPPAPSTPSTPETPGP